MTTVGNICDALLAPAALKTALAEIGTSRHVLSQSVLFNAGDNNAGVFLVCAGRVRLEVPGVPQLSRTFSTGSLLGLPSTFSEKPYNLTAISATDSDVIQVDEQKFLDLMKSQSSLCREATDILTREIAFILSALRRQPASAVAEAETSTSGKPARQ